MFNSKAKAILLLCLAGTGGASAKRNSTAPINSNSRLRRNQHKNDDDDDRNDLNNNVLTCRVTKSHTAFENENGTISYKYDHACIPITNGTETPFMHTVDFPESLLQQGQKQLNDGNLFVSIRGAQVSKERNRRVLIEQEKVEFIILEENPTTLARNTRSDGDGRKLQQYPRMPYTHAKGDRILTIVTVSTYDSSTTYSATQLKNSFFNQGNCLQSQWNRCSGNRFNWVPGEFLDVQISGSIGSYTTGGDAREEAIRQMKSNGLYNYDLQELGDNVIFVIPDGIQQGFVANAGVGFYISTYGDKWGNDLRAVSHELGHNFGLGHAGFRSDPYGDFTGYMASTSAPERADGPLMCFNAMNHHDLQWFSDRSMSVNGSKKIRLSAFTKYASSKQGDVLVIEVDNEIYIQYNAATGYNRDTGAVSNKVVVVRSEGTETERVAGLDVGGTYSYGSTKVEVCGKESGDMIVGVGVGNSNNLCNLPLANEKTGNDGVPENPGNNPGNSPRQPDRPPPRNDNPPNNPPRRPRRPETPPGNDTPRPPRPPFPPSGPTLSCKDTSSRNVEFMWKGESTTKTCREISRRHCRKENLASTNVYQRVFQVCEQQCPQYTGCGRPLDEIQNTPRPCIRERRKKKVKVEYRGKIQERSCRFIGSRPNWVRNVCQLQVVPEVFDARRPKVQDICEYECAQYLTCRR